MIYKEKRIINLTNYQIINKKNRCFLENNLSKVYYKNSFRYFHFYSILI